MSDEHDPGRAHARARAVAIAAEAQRLMDALGSSMEGFGSDVEPADGGVPGVVIAYADEHELSPHTLAAETLLIAVSLLVGGGYSPEAVGSVAQSLAGVVAQGERDRGTPNDDLPVVVLLRKPEGPT